MSDVIQRVYDFGAMHYSFLSPLHSYTSDLNSTEEVFAQIEQSI